MKRTMKRILNAATLVAMVLVMALSVLTITTFNGNAASTENNGASNVSSTQESANNVNDTNTEVPAETPEQTTNLSGIYKFTTNVGLNDVYYKSGDDFKHLRTENNVDNPYDVNAIYHDMKNLGFDDYANVVTHYNDLYRAIYFNNGKVQMMTYTDKDVFTFIPEDNFDFDYTVSESGIEITNEEAKARLSVKYDEETNTPSLYYLFEGYNYKGTEFYIRTDLSYVYDSINLFASNEYSFNSHSVTLLPTNTENTFTKAYIKLAKTLGFVEDTYTTEVFDEINNIVTEKLSSCTIYIDATDSTRIVVKYADGSIKISSSETSENNSPIFVWNNTNVKFNGTKYNSSTNSFTLSFSISLDENSGFHFKYSSAK